MDALVGQVIGFTIGFALAGLILRGNVVAGRIERKLDLLLRHSGVDVVRVAETEAGELARAGKKIDAIRVYRDLTGCGLAEAKSKVEGMS